MKFKVEDEVRFIDSQGPFRNQTEIFTLGCIHEGIAFLKGNFGGIPCEEHGTNWPIKLTSLELIKKSMNITEKFLLALKSEPEKSFRKTGITNGDDLLTDEGSKIFLSWLLEKNKDLFKTEVVDNLLAELDKE